MKTKYSILVVVYKTLLNQSQSLQSIAGINRHNFNYKLTVWDNSPDHANPSELVWIRSFVPEHQYFHTPENISLAKIYNRVTKLSVTSDILILLDQDSKFDELFLKKIDLASTINPDINLFVPYIMHDGQIVSPGNFFLIKGIYWKELKLGKIPVDNKVAIASGMSIRTTYLESRYPSFDERLKLYGIDSDFVLEYSRHNRYFYILDYQLQHNLSINEAESVERKLTRYYDFCFSILHIARKRSLGFFFLAKVYVFYYSIKHTMKYRDLRFFKGL